MNYIKSYKLFEGKIYTGKQHEYSIYDWVEDLKGYEWGTKILRESSLKLWTDHFVGSGYWEKIKSLVDKMFESISKVDIDYINDRMYDVYDEIVR